MPLVERYGDWNIFDGSFDDPHTLDFDHRIEACAARNGTGLADVEDNVKATCVISILKPEFGWTQVGSDWLYDPTHKEIDLNTIWRNNLPACIQHDKESLKHCFCNATTNPATAYVGAEAGDLSDKIDALEWPSNMTEFVSRFPPAGQYVIGPIFCSAYHLGDGCVGTAGHCLDKALLNSKLGELRVVFNWIGDVASKKTFAESEVFEIKRVAILDTHGPAPSPTDPLETAHWSRRWDSAIIKLIGTPDQLSHLRSAKYATRPPEFGGPVYNIGCPLGTQLKVSPSAHVLRHCLVGDDKNPFSHTISAYGSFTTDLDQFEGNSGGPVFDASTGYIVGHTSSTQDAVAESDAAAIELWAREYARDSNNYAIATEINCLLKKQEPNNEFYRVHPKFLRTLSGNPGDSPLIRCATNICPGDLGPNKVMQARGKCQAVSGRHEFGSKDAYLRNVTARVDRSAVFTTPLGKLLDHCENCLLTIRFAGRTGAFGKPDPSSILIITNGVTDWSIRCLDFHKDPSLSIPSGRDVWSVTMDLAVQQHEIPPAFLNSQRGLIDWTKLRLEQPLRNPPLVVGLNLSIRRPSYPFPVSKAWPPERPDVTDDPEEAKIRWPEETFEFATTAGDTSGILQTGGVSQPAIEGNIGPGLWIWETPINRVWTNPRQPSQGLTDSLMDNFDELLA